MSDVAERRLRRQAILIENSKVSKDAVIARHAKKAQLDLKESEQREQQKEKGKEEKKTTTTKA